MMGDPVDYDPLPRNPQSDRKDKDLRLKNPQNQSEPVDDDPFFKDLHKQKNSDGLRGIDKLL